MSNTSPPQGGALVDMARWMHEWYSSLTAAGFEEQQALTLVLGMLQAMVSSAPPPAQS